MPRASVLTAEEMRAQNFDIKPCPFCGHPDDTQLVDDHVHWPEISCTNCGATMHGESSWMAVVNWNQRAGDQPTDDPA